MHTTPLLAIFVGGKSTRMGTPKGLLEAPGGSESIVEALVQKGRDAGLLPVLVGEATPYAGIESDVPRIDDEPPGAGPLAGLNAAVRHAIRHGHPSVVAVACDMPHIEVALLERLASHESEAAVVAPRLREDAPWEPMLARYQPGRLASVLDGEIAKGTRSFQRLFAALQVELFPLTPEVARALEDWDTRDDVSA